MTVRKFLSLGALLLSLTLNACTDPPGATAILEDEGYTDIKITGYDWLACGKDDTYHTGFIATAKATGRRVTGVVCAGFLFKGATIRITGRAP